MDPKVEFCLPNNKFLHKSWSNSKIQNLNQISTSWPHQASAGKYWPNFSFKILLELKLQTLYQTLCSKSGQNLALWPNFSFQICIEVSSKRFSSSTSATVTTSTSFELDLHKPHVTSIKFTKQQSVSELVSELVTMVNNDRTRVR